MFALSYGDMSGLSTNIVSYKLPINSLLFGKAENLKIQAQLEFKDKKRGHEEGWIKGHRSDHVSHLAGLHCSNGKERWKNKDMHGLSGSQQRESKR